MSNSAFTTALLRWHATDNDRSLPWKEEKDPYKIWLSEIILQQTRAAQGLPYYLNFITAYPTVTQLAAAADEEVFRLWQGLGYYSRCKNMLVTARHISTSLNGCFPDTAAEIARLKGIGPYTAAAIASFAFNEPVAVVDGNVYRVLSRYLCIDTPCDTTAGKKEFTALARRYLATGSSAAYNQAIMDLGATVCTPRAPKCTACPVSDGCMALKKGTAQLLPVKSKKIKVTTRYFNFIILRNKGRIWLQKRGAGDIWENLHQPYLVETNNATGSIDITSLLLQAGINVTNVQPAGTSSQRLTHRIIKAECYLADAPEIVPGGDWYPLAECSKLAFPKTVNDFLIQNNII